MESLAFIHHAVAYADSSPEPELRSFNLSNWHIPSSAWMGLAGAITLLTILSAVTPAEAMVYRKGNTGAGVAEIQRSLGIPIDGIYGPVTEQAVLSHQSRFGLLADGKAGPETLNSLGLSRLMDTVSIAPASPGRRASGQAVIATRSGVGVNLRGAPNGAITGGLPDGAAVSVTGREVADGRYVWVELTDGQWVASDFLSYNRLAAAPGISPAPSSSGQGVPRSGTAIVSTPTGVGVNLRRTPNGDVVASLPESATVFLTGAEVAAGAYIWAETTNGAWIATDFLIGDVGQGIAAAPLAPAAEPSTDEPFTDEPFTDEPPPADDTEAIATDPTATPEPTAADDTPETADDTVETADPSETADTADDSTEFTNGAIDETAGEAVGETTGEAMGGTAGEAVDEATGDTDIGLAFPTENGDGAADEPIAADDEPTVDMEAAADDEETETAGETDGSEDEGTETAGETDGSEDEGTETAGETDGSEDDPAAALADGEADPEDVAVDPADDSAAIEDAEGEAAPADETDEFQGPRGNYTVKAPTELRSEPGGNTLTTLMPGEPIELTDRRQLDNNIIWAQTTDGSWIDVMAVDFDSSQSAPNPDAIAGEEDTATEAPPTAEEPNLEPTNDPAATDDFQGPSGTFTTEASVDRVDQPNGAIAGSIPAGSEFNVTARRRLVGDTVWAQLEDGSWVKAQQIDAAIANAFSPDTQAEAPEPAEPPTETEPSPEEAEETAETPEPETAAEEEAIELQIADAYVFTGPSGEFVAAATIEKRDNPYGLVIGSVSAGDEVELTGNRTFALNRTWAELNDGTWVDIRNLQAR